MVKGKNLTYTTFVDNALDELTKTTQEMEKERLKKTTKQELQKTINQQKEYIDKLNKDIEKWFGRFMCAFIIASFTTLFLLSTLAINTRLEAEVRTYQESIHLMKEE